MIYLLDKFTEDITSFSVSEKANTDLYDRFKYIENQCMVAQKTREEYAKMSIGSKLAEWLSLAGQLILRVFLILYFPIVGI